MSFNYTRAQLKSAINAGIQNRQGMIVDFDETINKTVRLCMKNLDFATAIRKVLLAPSLYNGIYDYPCPSDLSQQKIIDIPAQAGRQDGEFFLISSTEFDIQHPRSTVALGDDNGTRTLKINSSVDSKSIVISELDSATSGGGTWSAFGGVTNIVADTDNYIKGAGSLKFDIDNTSSTTAGIVNTSITSLDITDYFGGTSSIFVWAYITSTTYLTNYILRFGSDSSNYYSKTVTTQHDGTTFDNGWNLLRFDISSLTTTGTPNKAAIKYAAIYMTKTTAKLSESSYRFDYLVLKRGVIHNVEYYSGCGWQGTDGTYKENSTDDLDVLVAGADEYEIICAKGIETAAREVREYDIAKEHGGIYDAEVKTYKNQNPSKAKIMTSEYYAYQ